MKELDEKLSNAIIQNNLEEVKQLLANGADINSKGNNGIQ